MHEPLEQEVKRWFLSYVDGFREDEMLHPMLELKLGHTARVATYCRAIADSSGWSADTASLGEVGGWLHDVGRFSQWREFGTYQDDRSFDHAQRGCEILTGSAVLDGLQEDNRRRLLDAIALHNKRELPAGVAKDSLPLCHLVRDADKLDILDLTYRMLVEGTLHETQPQLSRELAASPQMIEEIRAEHRGSYANMRTLSDFVLVSVAWAWNLHFGASARLVLERGMFTRLEPFLPATEDVRMVLREALRELERVAAR
jgi:hypothetical protein